MPSKVLDEITYPYPNFNSATTDTEHTHTDMKVWMYLRLVIGLLFRKRLHFILLTAIHRFKVDFSVLCSICLKSGNMKPLVAKWPFCFKDIFIYIYIYIVLYIQDKTKTVYTGATIDIGPLSLCSHTDLLPRHTKSRNGWGGHHAMLRQLRNN